MTMRPESESELADAIRSATGPLTVRGGGTRDMGYPVRGTVLETGGLSGIVDYEPGALTLVVRAGTPLAEVEAALAAEGQRLAFEPPAAAGSTIGGVVATNASGPRRIAVGACRDFCLGVRFVDGSGTVIKNGGRVMKNVTGYDLVKLMAGSRGTLGVLAEISLKVLPMPEVQSTLIYRDLKGSAVGAMSRALGSPYDVTGAARGPVPGVGSATFLRLEGFEASVAYRAKALSALLAELGTPEIVSGEASDRIWRDIRDLRAFDGHRTVAAVSIKPSNLDDLEFSNANLFLEYGTKALGYDLLADWGGGLVWLAATDAQLEICARRGEIEGDPVIAGSEALLVNQQAYAAMCGGHARLFRGPGDLHGRLPLFQPELPAVAALTRGLRAKFDPRGILNPGLMSA